MNTSLRFLLPGLLAAGLAASGYARIDRTLEKTFAVTGPGVLRVDTQGGAIRVTGSAESVVRVTAKQRIRADSEAEADEVLKKLELTMEQTGNDVRVVSRYERRPFGFRFGSWPPVQVDVVVSVPSRFAAELTTSGGGIAVSDLGGKALLRTSGGSISLGRMGGEVDARTSGGSIALEEAGGAVALKTSGGGIDVGRVSGPADLATSGGSIKIESASGSLRAHTSGGGIRAGLTGPLREDSSLSTSGGSVRVTVDKKTAFRLDAASSGGGVDATGVTVTLEGSHRDRSRLSGAVNGGGPVLKLRSSGGGIVVRAD
jgi:DUF4097 and DUF4098 domain-containing protein YvlB